jgi:tocopherol cyclase
MAQRLRQRWTPAVYHGRNASGTFLEGWYYKLVSPDKKARRAIIPGIYRHESDPALSHAFVQVLDGRHGTSVYHRFPVEEFAAGADEVDVRIGPNRFRPHQFQLDLNSAGQSIQGELRFSGLRPWPVKPLSPGVMGWYAFVPFMQCYHGVLGLDHEIQGALTIDGRTVDFSGGRGYIEKDWGRAFPRAYVWMQSNHYAQTGISLAASIATIPWIRSWFRGFIVGFLHQGALYRFATYLGSQVDNLQVSPAHVEWALRGGRRSGGPGQRFRGYRLHLVADRAEGGKLSAPEPGGMIERVVESMTATIETRLTGIDGDGSEHLIFQGSGDCAALEVSGSIEEIVD